jgi:N-glycosidase YbiA
MKDDIIPPYAYENDTQICGFFGPNRFLSNFWPAPVDFMGVQYPSVENAYQAAKTLDHKQRLLVLNYPPAKAKKFGRAVLIRKDWEKIKRTTMFYLVMQKFSRGPLRDKLLATGDKFLEESNDWGDAYWGVLYKDINNEWTRMAGENHLGTILTRVRQIVA